ncbi:hypothetical protein PMI42_04858 [Bradyrhizobium sp. YR681]|uniref:hypothetical protein n=1 Tax=Bradyrhizobium sp. YR681 TaxID=1144344 RepID=UPI0002710D3F|nr:hypothetical protein [Bradyrhizobium sp. YR681]EJN11843.1 hypothetical protein PMI42_04858 [Bradyrhizobium sp. YR681]
MKVKMLVTPPGGRREFEKGETYDLEESYAKKFISRSWAEPADKAAERAAKEEQERSAATAKAKTEQEARDKAAAQLAARLEARGKIMIPADISNLSAGDVIKLAQSLSDDQIKTPDDAMKAIETEKARRNPT